MFDLYDVIVVGAGHAGCEAAVAAANLGSRVMLVTMNMQTIGQMSCNPAMGGVAKGQIVREIDALGGYSGLVTDATTIQFRMLNLSKGPAMWSPRAQNDRMLFAARWREMLEQHPNIDFWQEMVNGILVKDNRAVGVVTGMGQEIRAKAVILTNGTFLNGVIHIGEKQFGGGRAGEKASTGITEQLIDLGFEAARMKTGTPPRVDARSLDFSKMDVQPGDEKPGRFSFLKTEQPLVQLPCYITYTSQEVHDILKTGFDRSPMFNGRIQGLGPRYCPSIEDKIDRFSDKDRHQLFVEPEGLNTVEMYINGFSSSLPEDVQYNALRRVPGFENVKMFRPGYAIEYDFFPPTQLKPSLETHRIANLFFAGQINGTTGYEEAASQGLMAGINAHLSIHEQDPFILKRSDAYIGVLIDDLVNKGTDEPYRMFTSRAEYRILLRQDNADLRLSPLGENLGIRDMEPRMVRVREKEQIMAFVTDFFKKQSIDPDQINGALEQAGSAPLRQKVKLHSILLRPGIGIDWISQHVPFVREALALCDEESLLSAEIAMKYEGYIEKERDLAGKMERLEQIRLRPDFDYHALPSLSMEARQKLSAQKPATIGQASRISGVNPADISVLLVYVGR